MAAGLTGEKPGDGRPRYIIAAAAAAAAAAGWCPGIMGYLPAECGIGILMDTGLIPGEGIPMGVPAEDIILR